MTTVIQPTPTEESVRPPLPQADSCVLVIFGATGDLTRRKLIPALYDLACAGSMRARFDIVGIGRTPLTTEEFRKRMREAAGRSSEARNFTGWCWSDFERRLYYCPGDGNNPAFYPELAARLAELRQAGSSANLLFYVATPATLAGPIVEQLGASGLAHRSEGWSRIVLEKPFGRDLASARELNRAVLSVFDERDIYRIDHYLGKETVQNILMFRFGNSLFEPVWNRNYIDFVEVTVAETLGVETRAAFYEETGALRDMVANHMLQLLALTAMEPPIAFDADSVREQKVQLFRSIRPMSVEEVARRTVRGQYGPGAVEGLPVPGYRQEQRVAPHSSTETYAALQLHVENWRWAGVPFLLRTGKRLAQRLSEIRVHLKRTPHTLFARGPEEQLDANVITLRIQPDEGIAVHFLAKRPGLRMVPADVKMDFCYRRVFGSDTPAAYETLLLDAMRGDATLFTRGDEVEAEWKIITPIEEAWAQLPAPEFPNYAAGSGGPAAADALPGPERHWRPL